MDSPPSRFSEYWPGEREKTALDSNSNLDCLYSEISRHAAVSNTSVRTVGYRRVFLEFTPIDPKQKKYSPLLWHVLLLRVRLTTKKICAQSHQHSFLVQRESRGKDTSLRSISKNWEQARGKAREREDWKFDIPTFLFIWNTYWRVIIH